MRSTQQKSSTAGYLNQPDTAETPKSKQKWPAGTWLAVCRQPTEADGTVRLIGAVDTNYERAVAADVASIEGVKRVENELELEKPSTRYVYSA